MDKKQQSFIRKVKLKLVQPQMICSGRDFIECYYRGKIIEEGNFNYQIEFKYKGEVITALYNKKNGFYNKDLQDIKIVD